MVLLLKNYLECEKWRWLYLNKKNELFHYDFSKEFHKKFGEEIIPDELFY